MMKLRISMLALALVDSMLVYFATIGINVTFALNLPEYVPAVVCALTFIALASITAVRCYKIRIANDLY